MEDSKNNKNISIFLNTEEKRNDVLTGASAHEKYIILTNDTLMAEHKHDTEKIQELETANAELEEASDKAENSTRYMKGLLKNFVEINKAQTEVVEKISTIDKSNKLLFENIKAKVLTGLWHSQCFILLMLVVLLQISLYQFRLLGLLCSAEAFLYYLEQRVKLINYPGHSQDRAEIRKLRFRIKEITDGQDFICEHIDNL